MSKSIRPMKERPGYFVVPVGAYTEEQGNELATVPGLKPSVLGFVGAIDAASAAAVLLGLEPPEAPEVPVLLGAGHDVTLRDYQVVGVSFLQRMLKDVGGALLADDMGLGKTLQALTAMKLLVGESGRALVLAPAAALETWRAELEKWGFKSACILTSTRTKKAAELEAPPPEAQVVVTSHDHRMVEKAIETAFENRYPDMLVIDEAHRFRGRESRRSDALSDLAPLIRYRLAVTGTPMFSRPRDWWMLLRLLFGYRFGNRYDFDRRYCGAGHNGFGWQNKGATNLDELKLRLSFYMLRREKGDVAEELPPLTRQVRWLESTPDAKKAYQRFKLGLDRGSMFAAEEATLKGKADEALALAEEAGRFLLFTWRKVDARYFHETLNERGVPCVLITGDMTVEKRAASVRLAREKKQGIVATLDSAAEALNLQGVASVGIMHAIDPLPLKMAQAEARLHRLGTAAPVLWYYLAMKDSVDIDLVRIVVDKLDAWVKTMGREKKAMLEAFDSYINTSNDDTERAIMRALYEELTA